VATSLAARERINQRLRAGWKLAPIVEVTNADVPLSFNAPNRELEGSADRAATVKIAADAKQTDRT
jgi:hypothetical protein